MADRNVHAIASRGEGGREGEGGRGGKQGLEMAGIDQTPL